MRTRTLPRSKIAVSEIGLGTWGLSGEAYGPVDKHAMRATVEAALDEGVDFIETAGCYGPSGAMEWIIGDVLRTRGRDAGFVCTRIGVDREVKQGPARKRFDKRGIVELTHASLERLGLDSVDALMLHNPLRKTLDDPRREAIDVMLALRAQKLTRFVGVSVSSVVAALSAIRAGVDLLELPYNLLYPRVLNAIAVEVREAKVGIIVRSPLAYGLLADTFAADRIFHETDHRRDRWTPAELARRIRQREAMRFLVKPPHASLREAAIRWVLANDLVHTVVVGARTPEQARENAHAADVLPYLSDEDLSAVTARIAEQAIG